MLQHTLSVVVSGSPQVLTQFRNAYFDSIVDDGVVKPMLNPRAFMRPPEHVVRWMDSTYSERLAGHALYLGEVPPAFFGLVPDLPQPPTLGDFVRRMVGPDDETARLIAADLKAKGLEFFDHWIATGWGSNVDPSSTVIHACKSNQLVFEVKAYGPYSPTILLDCARAQFPTLHIAHAMEPAEQAQAA